MKTKKTLLSLLTAGLIINCLPNFGNAQEMNGVVSRKDWGARGPRPDISKYQDYNLSRPVYNTVVLHVTALGGGVGVDEVRKIQDYQMDVLNFSDMAYNYLIDSNGQVFEGRSLDFVPSHAGQTLEANQNKDIRLDPDYGAVGIVFSAGRNPNTGQEFPITPNQIASAEALIRTLAAQPGFKFQKVITHAEVPLLIKSKRLTPDPASKFNPHMCPGTHSVEQLVALRKSLTNLKIPFNEKEFRSVFTNP